MPSIGSAPLLKGDDAALDMTDLHRGKARSMTPRSGISSSIGDESMDSSECGDAVASKAGSAMNARRLCSRPSLNIA